MILQIYPRFVSKMYVIESTQLNPVKPPATYEQTNAVWLFSIDSSKSSVLSNLKPRICTKEPDSLYTDIRNSSDSSVSVTQL